MQKYKLTCIECPIGCSIEATKDGEKITVTGNSCPRGKMYAENEVVCPKRVLTTTVKTTSGEMLPVKTNKPVKKSEQLALMKKINRIVAQPPIAIGDVVFKKIDGEADLIATGRVE